MTATTDAIAATFHGGKRANAGRKNHPPRDELIAAITELGARLHGDGFAPRTREWNKQRDAAQYPPCWGVYRQIVGEVDSGRTYKLVMAQWLEVLAVLGLDYPVSRSHKNKPKQTADFTGPDVEFTHRKQSRTINRFGARLITSGWQRKTYYHPRRRAYVTSWVAQCK